MRRGAAFWEVVVGVRGDFLGEIREIREILCVCGETRREIGVGVVRNRGEVSENVSFFGEKVRRQDILSIFQAFWAAHVRRNVKANRLYINGNLYFKSIYSFPIK